MRRFTAALFIAGCAGLAASCSTSNGQETRSPKAQRELADALAGRTAGPSVRCLPSYRSRQMQVIDDWTIIFRDGKTVYVQNPRGGCRGLGSGAYTLVTKTYGIAQQCDGDLNQLVDLRTGMMGGSCVFGPFTPYTKP